MFRKKKNSEIEELKKEKTKTIGRMIVIGFDAAVVIIALTIAWFVSNTKVRGTGAAVSADARSVELRTKGGAGIHDDILKKIMKKENKGEWYSIAKNILETSPEKYTVNWLLSPESNMGNYSSDQKNWEDYWTNPDNHRQDQAIEPGSSGTLTFYVVPKKAGDFTLHMKLSLIPYQYNTSKEENLTEADSCTKDLVSGHILLFLEEKSDSETDTSKENTELRWLPDGSFSLTITGAEMDKEYPYTLYWCWPQTFAETMLKEGDSLMNGRSPLLSMYKNGAALRKEIARGKDNTYSMINMPERYFYSNLTKSPLQKGQTELSVIEQCYDQSSADMQSEETKNAFIDLSSYYNQADQYIGSKANCLRVKLEMQPEMQTESQQ